MTDKEVQGVDTSDDDLSDEDKAYFDSGGEEPEGEPEAAVDTKSEEASEGEPEAKADGEGEDDPEGGDKPRQETVPHKTFHAERERRKIAEEAAKANEIRSARLEERMNMLLQAQQAQEQPKDEMPGEDDPMGRLNWTAEQVRKQQEQAAENERQYEQRMQRQQYETQVVDAADAQFKAAAAEDPDLVEQRDHVINSRGMQLQAMGYPTPQINAIIKQELLAASETSLQTGRPVADVIRQYAQSYGWTKKQEEAAQEAVSDAETNAGKIDSINAAQKAAKSLSSVPGSAGGTVTAADIDAMDDDEYSAYLATVQGQKEWRSLNGV